MDQSGTALYRHGKDVSGVVEVKTKGGEAMTREEAIKILGEQHRWTGEPEKLNSVRAINEALYMAMKALENERPEVLNNWVTTYDILKVEHEIVRENSIEVWECGSAAQRADICLWLAGVSAMTDKLIKVIEGNSDD